MPPSVAAPSSIVPPAAASVTPPPGAPRSRPVREAAAQDELARGIEPMPRQRINNLPLYALIGPHLGDGVLQLLDQQSCGKGLYEAWGHSSSSENRFV